jgi:hypothetical protein
VAETTVKRLLCAGFDALVKRWDKCMKVGGGYVEKINVFPRFEYHMFYVLYPFVTYLLTLPRTYNISQVGSIWVNACLHFPSTSHS